MHTQCGALCRIQLYKVLITPTDTLHSPFKIVRVLSVAANAPEKARGPSQRGGLSVKERHGRLLESPGRRSIQITAIVTRLCSPPLSLSSLAEAGASRPIFIFPPYLQSKVPSFGPVPHTPSQQFYFCCFCSFVTGYIKKLNTEACVQIKHPC